MLLPQYCIRLILLFALVMLHTGCISMQQQADRLARDGSYETAITIYQQILARDPQNSKVASSLRNAQLAWIDTKLIDVRFFRLANNLDQSLELLRKIYQKENQWKVFPIGAAASTQSEELELAQRSIIERVEISHRNQLPLQSKYYLQHYRLFFQSNQNRQQLQQLLAITQQQGEKQCAEFSLELTPQQLFYGKFVSTICRIWGLSPPSLEVQINSNQNLFYSSVKLDNRAHGLPYKYDQSLESLFSNQLQQTPWFSAGTRQAMQLEISGSFEYSYTSRQKSQTQSYVTSEPYDYTWVESQPEHDKSQNRLVPSHNQENKNRKIVDNKNGTISISETRFRDVTKFVDYDVTEHREFFDITLSVRGALEPLPIKLNIRETHRNNSVSHNNKLKAVGVSPQKAIIIGESVWLKQQADKLQNHFHEALVNTWDQRHCHAHTWSHSQANELESMFRCIELKKEDPPLIVNAWFEYNLGINYQQFNELSGER
ncbi:MAG: tetratricopeptide repeat protein [Gammaproteobacteria bacterium]|nr:tetratricopeptide repeat protein [Gammaproteobacteria bacterium]